MSRLPVYILIAAVLLTKNAWAADSTIIGGIFSVLRGLYTLVFAASYVLGAALGVAFLMRLYKHSRTPLQAPGGYGTAACFFASLVFFFSPGFLSATAGSLFGGAVANRASFIHGGGEINQSLLAVLAVIQFVGLLAFLKGPLVIKAANDHKQGASVAAGCWHMVGGVLAYFIIPIIQSFQETFGWSFINVS